MKERENQQNMLSIKKKETHSVRLIAIINVHYTYSIDNRISSLLLYRIRSKIREWWKVIITLTSIGDGL